MFPVLPTSIEEAVLRAAGQRELDLQRADPEARRGVVHTPLELARFVARLVDDVLRTELRVAGGLGDPRVSIVDPACGPGVFLAVLDAFGVTSAREVVGIERDRATAQSAARLLDAHGVPARIATRDTLSSLDVFEVTPEVAVVLGNPPWSGGRASSRGDPLIEELLEDFRRDENGERLRERKLGVLSDEYVRFVRWSAEIVRRSECGLMALVTNGSFLDGPVHRGMRSALGRWFDGIDIVNLGGNALVAHDGVVDENVFGVRPSVAVTLAWRHKPAETETRRVMRYLRLTGRVEAKTEAMAGRSRSELAWQTLSSSAPFHLFVPIQGDSTYRSFTSLAEVMPFHREGVQTNRDRSLIDRNPECLRERLSAFATGIDREDLAPLLIGSRHYDPNVARAAVRDALTDSTFSFEPIAYRPFDDRWFAPVRGVCHRARPKLRQAMARSSHAILTVRKDRGSQHWCHFGATRHIVDNCYLSTRSSCRTRAFPSHDPDGALNFDSAALAGWEEQLGVEVTSIAFMRYALAVLASPLYRATFEDELRLDYPRIPAPHRLESFDSLVAQGAEIERVFLASIELSSDSDEERELGHLGHHRLRRFPGELGRLQSHLDRDMREVLVNWNIR